MVPELEQPCVPGETCQLCKGWKRPHKVANGPTKDWLEREAIPCGFTRKDTQRTAGGLPSTIELTQEDLLFVCTIMIFVFPSFSEGFELTVTTTESCGALLRVITALSPPSNTEASLPNLLL